VRLLGGEQDDGLEAQAAQHALLERPADSFEYCREVEIPSPLQDWEKSLRTRASNWSAELPLLAVNSGCT
jgi:hypothetical protein